MLAANGAGFAQARRLRVIRGGQRPLCACPAQEVGANGVKCAMTASGMRVG